jgi:ABC-type antimicrobial peptide transport system permease subunit
MALGARPAQVLSAVLGRILVLCGTGISLGTVVTLGGARFLSAVLYGVGPRDPLTYLAAVVLLTGVAVMACWNPAVRAIRIDPARTLREE